MSKKKNQILKAAGFVSAATLISRVFGFIRDMLIANAAGTGFVSDAFFVAFRIPNLLRRLLGEGAMSAAFIPVFTEYLTVKGKKEAWHIANSIISFLFVILSFATIFGIIWSPQIVHFISPGFDNPDKFVLTVSLTRIMFPFIFFISLAAIVMGILNSMKIFFIPSLTPACFNITVILFILFFSRVLTPAKAIAYGVVAGSFFQFALQLPPLFKNEYKFSWTFDYKNTGVRRIGKLLGPALIGVAPYQISIFIDTVLASFLDEGSISYLFYSNRLVQFPLGIFGIAMSIAVLPIMSEFIAKSDEKNMKKTLAFALRCILFMTIPASVGLIILRIPIIHILFEYGKFTSLSTYKTGEALLYYSLGLWAFAGVKIVSSAFYAMKDTKTPVKIASISLVLNIILNILLMIKLKHGGLALGTSLSSAFNVVILLILLRKRIGTIEGKSIFYSCIKSVFASTIMGGCIYYLIENFFFTSSAKLYNVVLLGGIIFIGILLYIGFSLLLKNTEMTYLLKIIRDKFSKKKTDNDKVTLVT